MSLEFPAGAGVICVHPERIKQLYPDGIHDRVNSQIRLYVHREIDRLFRITRCLADHLDQLCGNCSAVDGQGLAVFGFARKHVVSIYDTYGIAVHATRWLPEAEA